MKTKNITISPIKTKHNDMTLDVPTTVHVELTPSCILKCRHCYNYWRHKNTSFNSLTRDKLDFILHEIVKNNVMHVIFTGGEPLLNYENLYYGIKLLKSKNISVSCNSNLMLASEYKMKRLRKAGLEHILTSLNSFDPQVNDFIVTKKGAFNQIVKGIKVAVASGIRISVNMITIPKNISHIYRTAQLSADLGAKSFFATRAIPNVDKSIDDQKEFIIYKKEARIILDELLRIRKQLGLKVGSLIPFPFCFLRNPTKYQDIYTHGCPAGNKMLSINADGEAHACVHESESYGSIFKIGLKGVWRNMYDLWQKGDAFPLECKCCEFFEKCNSGCPLIGRTISGRFGSFDILREGWEKSAKKSFPNKVYSELKNKKFFMSDNLRFRKEKGCYVIDRFGSEIVCVKTGLANKLIKFFKKRKFFDIEDFGKKYKKDLIELLNQRLIKISAER